MSAIVDALRRGLAPATPEPDAPDGVPAGVMVPLVDRAPPSLLLTRRTDRVRHHKGEISFPGGVRHEEDAGLLVTALRETEEELGIPPGAFDVVGALPPTHTVVSGFIIVPFVGVLAEVPPLRTSPDEIEEVLELEVGRLSRAEREVNATDGDGGSHSWFAYEVDGHLVWGATGRILHAFLETIRAEEGR